MVFYGFHFPECLSPGSFDIIGHSHQLFHICGFLANYEQMRACFIDLKSFRSGIANGRKSVLWVVAVLLVDLAVVGFFAFILLRRLKRPSGSVPESENELEPDNNNEPKEPVTFGLPDEN